MKRRSALKAAVIFGLGTSVLYSCESKKEAVQQVQQTLSNLKPTEAQQQLLLNLSERIVPLSAIPALKDHVALPFIMKMVNDVYEKEDRDKFVLGYQTFTDHVEGFVGKPYEDCSDSELNIVLTQLDRAVSAKDDVPPEVMVYRTLKNEGLRYLSTTEHILRDVRGYKMVQGEYKPDVSIFELKNKNLEANG